MLEALGIVTCEKVNRFLVTDKGVLGNLGSGKNRRNIPPHSQGHIKNL
jgi:hypothetical protein